MKKTLLTLMLCMATLGLTGCDGLGADDERQHEEGR
jgi:hypothetical protein